MAKKRVRPADRLRASMAGRGLRQAELARLLGVHYSVVCRWLSGDRVPSWESALAIERELGIPALVWLDEAEARRTAHGGAAR